MRHRRSDDGFSLVEVVVALALLAIVTASAATFFIRGMQSSITMQHRQSAAAVNGQAMEKMRAYNSSVDDGQSVTTSDLFTAHNLTSTAGVSSAWTAVTGTKVSDTDQIYLANGVSGTAPQPYAWTDTAKVSNVDYTTRMYVGRCWSKTGGGSTFTCDNSATGDVMVRVVAVTTWKDIANRCDRGACSFRASAYIDTHTDPQFDSQAGTP